MLRHSFAVVAAVLLCACSTMSSFSAPRPGTTMALRGEKIPLPTKAKVKGTSFANYEFKASEADGAPFYGILPLKFKGGHLAADILLFAPAAFFNLRSAFPYYEIDPAQGVIRYKEDANAAWNEYRPKPEEAARAKEYYEQLHGR